MIGQAVMHHLDRSDFRNIMRCLTRDMKNKNQDENISRSTPPTKKVKNNDQFNLNEFNNKEINRSENPLPRLPFSEFKVKFEDYTSIVDGCFDQGIEFEEQESKIDLSEMKTNEDLTKQLDHIFNVEGMFTWNTNIDNMILCEIPPNLNWEDAVKIARSNVFLYTGYKEWIWLKDKQSYKIETNMSGKTEERIVWMGELCTFDTVKIKTCMNLNIQLSPAEPPEFDPSASMPSDKLRITTTDAFCGKVITIHHVKKTDGPQAGKLMLKFEGLRNTLRYSVTSKEKLYEQIKKNIKCQEYDPNKLYNGMKFALRDLQ